MKEAQLKTLRIILVGKTGAGKSSSANTILGDVDAFEANMSPKAVTSTSLKKSAQHDGYNIEVIDTPGLFHTSNTCSEETTQKELKECIKVSLPGPHAFLLVVRLGRFTPEESNAVEWIQKNFGEKASDFTILLFTGGDQLKNKTIHEFIEESDELKKVKDKCKGRYHVFNNKDTESRQQVEDLLNIIKDMVAKNGGRHYTNKMYEEAQRKIEEEQRQRQEEEERKRREHEEKIREDERRKMAEEKKRKKKRKKVIPTIGAATGAGVGGAGAVVTACVVETAVAAVVCPILLVVGGVLGLAAGFGYYIKKR